MLLARGVGMACLSAARARGAHLPRPGAAMRLADECKACGRKRALPAVPLTGAQIWEPRARPGALMYPRQALQHISYLPGLFLARPAPHGGWAHYLPFLCVLRWRSVGRVSQVNLSSIQQPLGEGGGCARTAAGPAVNTFQAVFYMLVHQQLPLLLLTCISDDLWRHAAGKKGSKKCVQTELPHVTDRTGSV